MTAYEASEWSDLFVASAGAAAALAGLVFVAVSINLERILALPGIPERAMETLVLLLGVAVVSIIGLIPGQSETALGVELLGQSLLWIGAMVPLMRRSLPRGEGMPRSWMIGRLMLAGLALVPFLVGAITLLAESGGGLYWTAGGIVASIVAGVINAWVLLVEILR